VYPGANPERNAENRPDVKPRSNAASAPFVRNVELGMDEGRENDVALTDSKGVPPVTGRTV
jgi:hypothetical protein